MRAKTKKVLPSVLVACLLLLLGLNSIPNAHANPANPDPVTITKHADLGFTTSKAINVDTGVNSPPCLLTVVVCLFHGAIAFHGTMSVAVKFGVDVALTYNPSDLNTPGGSLPVTLKYTPTMGGASVNYALTGNMIFNFDGCTNCPATIPFSLNSASSPFTAPMGSDGPITIPATSSGITLSVAGLDVITASLGSSLTLSPATPGLFPGLGGAAAEIQVTGASGAPPLPIEWDSAGAEQHLMLTTPPTPTPIGIQLTPLLHWVSTSGSAQINLHWTSDFQTAVAVVADIVTAGVCALPFVDCSISDPGPISLFSGGLGPQFHQAGIDTDIGNAIGGTVGNLVAGRVADGFVPIPLTAPALATIPPVTPGALTFDLPAAAIAGAPAGIVLSGDSVTLNGVASGGTAPFTYAWTKNGGPFASTQSITDTPSLGDTSYAVTVTDSLGAVSNTANTVVSVYDFTIAGSPTSLQILTSGSNTYAITEALVAGSSTTGLPTNSLSVSGLPSGTTPNFSPASGNASGFTSTLTLTTVNAPAGTYTLTLIGTDARPQIGGTRSTTLTLQVLTPAQAIPNVIASVNVLRTAGVLNGGMTNSLLVKLNHAITSLNTRPPDQPTACNQLQAFVNEVNAYVAAGILTQPEADVLLGGPLGIKAIMASIPC
jgi:hypothetical protein